MCDVCPLNPLSTFKGGCLWLSTGHLLLYHARFSQDLHMDDDPSPVGSRYREIQVCEMVVLLELEFWGVEQNIVPNMW